MPDSNDIVINTGPLIAIAAGLGNLAILKSQFDRVYVPHEVSIEMRSALSFATNAFQKADWLQKMDKPLKISSYLTNSLDKGEASVIQFALEERINKVCIDEAAGRRIARLNGIAVTGSIGILIRARNEGYPFSMRVAIDQMLQKGVWLSEKLIDQALREAGEQKS